VRLLDEKVFPVASPAFAEKHRITKPADLLRVPLPLDQGIPCSLWLKEAGVSTDQPVKGTSFSDADLLLQAATEGRGRRAGQVAPDSERHRVRTVRPAFRTQLRSEIRVLHRISAAIGGGV
jgi:hypothetical protein